jgi:hypothetical protein
MLPIESNMIYEIACTLVTTGAYFCSTALQFNRWSNRDRHHGFIKKIVFPESEIEIFLLNSTRVYIGISDLINLNFAFEFIKASFTDLQAK